MCITIDINQMKKQTKTQQSLLSSFQNLQKLKELQGRFELLEITNPILTFKTESSKDGYKLTVDGRIGSSSWFKQITEEHPALKDQKKITIIRGRFSKPIELILKHCDKNIQTEVCSRLLSKLINLKKGECVCGLCFSISKEEKQVYLCSKCHAFAENDINSGNYIQSLFTFTPEMISEIKDVLKKHRL